VARPRSMCSHRPLAALAAHPALLPRQAALAEFPLLPASEPLQGEPAGTATAPLPRHPEAMVPQALRRTRALWRDRRRRRHSSWRWRWRGMEWLGIWWRRRRRGRADQMASVTPLTRSIQAPPPGDFSCPETSWPTTSTRRFPPRSSRQRQLSDGHLWRDRCGMDAPP
jgi:hypothetical protein